MITPNALPVLSPALLRPERVVLVGASSRDGSVGQVIGSNLRFGKGLFQLMTVNPNPVDWMESQNFASIAEIPRGPGLAVLAIPASAVPTAIEALGDKGIQYAVIISAGLHAGSEPGKAMLDAARESSVRIIGPNCLGLMLPHQGLNASFARSAPTAGDLALLSQSGAIATAMLEWAEPRGVGFSAVFSVGDMAQTGMGELVRLLHQDDETRAILIYLEGLTDADAFLEAADKASRDKPVIVLKAGRSNVAARAALSHTGALAGSWDVYRAAFREAGIVAVDTLEEMFDAANLLRQYPEGADRRLAIVTNGGGAGILAVDAMVQSSVELASLHHNTLEELKTFLPPTWSGANPVDIIGDADSSRYERAVELVLSDPCVDGVLVMNCPTGLLASGEAAAATARSVDRVRKKGVTLPVFGCWLGDANFAGAAKPLGEAQIPVFETPMDAVRGFSSLVQVRRTRQRAPRLQAETLHRSTVGQAPSLINKVKADGRHVLSEVEAKALLSMFGVPVVETRLLGLEDDFERACAGINPPYALKIVSPDITHKSDFGGVALGLSDVAAVRRTAASMKAHISRTFPEARIEGFALQPMVARKSAHELFAGIAQDETFGPIVLFGAGGTAIEVIADKAVGIPPICSRQARGVIADTRIARLLAGYRHVPPVDMNALELILIALSRLALALPEVDQLDVNPLLANDEGVVALDARVILR